MAYLISTDPSLLDVDAVHAYLTRSYWAQGIPRDVVARALTHSLCFGLYHEPADGGARTQVGLARVITDRATYAYLCDVYVREEHQGRGLGKRLIGAIMRHPDLQGLRRLGLFTRDAHGLYEGFGFTALSHPERAMERRDPDVYRRSRTGEHGPGTAPGPDLR